MPRSFTFVGKPDRKISLERNSHPCPKCKHHASVQLIRSEKQWILLNKCISSVMRVRYECSRCTWRNEELPYHQDVFKDSMLTDDHFLSHYNDFNKTSSSIASAVF